MSARIAGEHSSLPSSSSFHRVRRWWSPQNHHLFTEIPAGGLCRLCRDRCCWFDCGYVFMCQSRESVGIISHFFCMKVDSDREVDSLPALQEVVLLHALVSSTLLTTSDISTHARQLIYGPQLRSCGAASCIDCQRCGSSTLQTTLEIPPSVKLGAPVKSYNNWLISVRIPVT